MRPLCLRRKPDGVWVLDIRQGFLSLSYYIGLMGLPVARAHVSVEQYLRLEREAPTRHEYHDGQIFDMAGESYEHSLIVANTIRALGNAVSGTPCRVLASNLKIGIARSCHFVYPDLSIVCGPPQFDARDSGHQTVTNPRVVAEVLSPSTESYDRGSKFDSYRELESFEEYVLIAQDRPAVETFFRQADGTWLFTPCAGVESTIKLRCLAAELRLAEMYAGVTFPESQEETAEPSAARE